MLRSHRILAVICLTLGAPLTALAQSVPSSTTALTEVVVVANRTPEPLSSVGNSVTVLDAEQIRTSQATLVSDLLALTPGLSYARNGGIGQPTSIFIRGAESDQTVVVIDGVQFNDPSLPGGNFDFAHLLTGNIARIEVLRGAQSTLYGSQAMGGVINIITAEPSKAFDAGVTAEGGSHGTGYFSGDLGGRGEDLIWRLAGNFYTSEGIPCFDQYLGGRRDCASRIGGGTARVRYELTPDLAVDVHGYYVQARTDFDGFDTPTFSFGDDAEYGRTRQFFVYTGLTYQSPQRTLTQRLDVQDTYSESHSYDPNAPTNFGAPSTETYFGFGRNLREEYQGTWVFTPSGHIVFGAQHERSSIDTDTPAYDVVPMRLEQDVAIDSGYAQLQAEAVQGLTLTVGGRYDEHEVYGGHSTGQVAAAWRLNDGATVLRASFGQGFKAPSLYQLYSNYGNLALQPEQANSWDAGLEQQALAGQLIMTANYFERSSRDLIGFFDCSTPSPLCATEPFGYYANIARALARGLELAATYTPSAQLTLAANYTLTDTEDRSPGSSTYGNELPRRPRDLGNASVTYRWPWHLSTSVAARYAGRSFDDAANQVPLGGYVLLDLRFSYTLEEHLEIYARLENATDRHYEVAYQYGTLGRVAYAGFRARL